MDGKTHDRVTSVLTTASIFGALALHLYNQSPLYISEEIYTLSPFFCIGVFSGLYVSPDLDGHSSNAKTRWGMFKFIWKPYRALIPRHRHVLSHLPILGTSLRYLYLRTIPAFIMGQPLGQFHLWEIALVMGLMLADTGHWFCDSCPIEL